MLDRRFIRNNAELVKAALDKRGYNYDLSAFLELDKTWREKQLQLESLQHERKKLSLEVPIHLENKRRLSMTPISMRDERFKEEEKKTDDAIEKIKERVRKIGDEIKELEASEKELEKKLENELLFIPNIPHESVPAGPDENYNQVVKTWGAPQNFDFEPKDHVEVGQKLGILDFERASKLSGARFYMLWDKGSALERALITFMLDLHTKKHGYTEVWVPFMVTRETMTGTGQLPKFSDELFWCERDDLWLVPTAEVPVTNIYRNETLFEEDLPVKLACYTPCFRREAGAYGKITKGLIRLHQFNKVELVWLAHPEKSWEALELLTADAEDVLKQLGLHYRIVALCTGDLGFSAAKTYDLEVWLSGMKKFVEISSCSNFTDFQARRIGIKYRSGKKTEFLHTLNGSGVAIGRTMVAILENYQQKDGSLIIPEVLRPYMDGIERIEPKR